LLENNRWLKGVPTTLTICNSLCGFAAILYTLHVYDPVNARSPENIFAISAWIILAAMIFDALDGFAARIFNAASMHGVQMDSLADMVTFGVAPAVLVSVMVHSLREMKHYQYLFLWTFCAIYLGCAALRLATYNVHAILERKSGDKFSGLPSPGAAAAVCSLVIFYSMKSGEIKQILSILPIYACLLGLLMVSDIKYLHVGKWVSSVRRNPRHLLWLIVACVIFVLHPQFTAVFLVNAYVLSGPFFALIRKLGFFKEEDAPHSPVSAVDASEKTS
jgi:CDP-diacylglycerol--serine O-phosphatidyltransferase